MVGLGLLLDILSRLFPHCLIWRFGSADSNSSLCLEQRRLHRRILREQHGRGSAHWQGHPGALQEPAPAHIACLRRASQRAAWGHLQATQVSFKLFIHSFTHSHCVGNWTYSSNIRAPWSSDEKDEEGEFHCNSSKGFRNQTLSTQVVRNRNFGSRSCVWSYAARGQTKKLMFPHSLPISRTELANSFQMSASCLSISWDENQEGESQN